MFDAITHTGYDLTLLTLLPLAGGVLMFFLDASKEAVARLIALIVSGAALLKSLLLLRDFNGSTAQMQFTERLPWLPDLGVNYVLGVDGISIWLLVLTTFLSFLVIMASESVQTRVRSYLGCLLLLESGMLGALVALDGITFYVFWELMLVPMYFLIGVWGGKRRIYAALKFFIYTALGSLLMLVAMIYLAYAHERQMGHLSFFLGDWIKLNFTSTEEITLFLAFALAFAIKIPLFPFHTWLPDAHVEAPTGGSVILAGVLLKLGLYGLIRFGIPVFPYATVQFAPVFAVLGVVGIIFGALVAWTQDDMKKLVAYSSVSHLGFCVLGFAAMSFEGLQGAMIQMINHGISTGALFFLVGVLYDRKHTRLIADYGGLAAKIPVFSFVFLVFTLSSIGLPLTNGFVGEFVILLAGYAYWPTLGVFAVSGVILGAMYMLSLYRRIVFGQFNESRNGDLTDLSLREKAVFAPLLVLVFILGVYPQPVFDRMAASSRQSLRYIKEAQVIAHEAALEAKSEFAEDVIPADEPVDITASLHTIKLEAPAGVR